MKRYNITVNGTVYDVAVEEAGADAAPAAAAPAAKPAAPKAAPKPAASGTAGAVKISAPMPGTIVEVKARATAFPQAPLSQPLTHNYRQSFK